MKLAAAFCFVLVSCAAATANFDSGLSRSKEFIADRKYVDALSELDAIRSLDSEKFHLNNLDYLLARIAEKQGDKALAMANYNTVVSRRSILSEYALWHMSRIAADMGNRFLERLYLSEIALLYKDSLLAAAAKNKLARSWLTSGNYTRAINALEDLQTGRITACANDTSLTRMMQRENMAMLAEAHIHIGDRDKARQLYTALINETANAAMPDDLALAGARGLDLLDVGSDQFQKKAPKITDAEHKQRAHIYFFNRDFHNAHLHHAAITAEHPNSQFTAEAIFQIGRGHVQTGNFSESIIWFERLIEQYSDNDLLGDALLNAGSSYSRVGKFREAVGRYQRYIAKFPEGDRLDRAYLNIIDVLRDQGETTAALQQAMETAEKFRGRTAEAQARFAEARIHLSLENWAAAMDSLNKTAELEELGGVKVPGGTDRTELAFLRAYVNEMQRNFPQAIEAYLSIQDGRNEFYGGLATSRLRSLAEKPESQPAVNVKLQALVKRSEDPSAETKRVALQSAIRLVVNAGTKKQYLERLKKVYSELPEYSKTPDLKVEPIIGRKILSSGRKQNTVGRNAAIADEFLFLGLLDEAAPEHDASNRLKGSKAALQLAGLYAKGDRADKIVSIAEPQWNKLPADFQIELMPVDSVMALYPVPFADELLDNAQEFGIDQYLLLAIMRQESRFKPGVKSNAAARGLMQFISTTSNRIAGSLRIDDFQQNDLYDPRVAIMFGSRYVADLFKMFPNQSEAVAASYNGGEDNMKRWYDRSRSSYAGIYVPEIAFSQSKDYVHKVMTAQRLYKAFYDEDLKIVSSEDAEKQ